MINTMDTTETTKNGDMVNLRGQLAISTKEIMKEMYEAATVRCSGQMVAIIKANG